LFDEIDVDWKDLDARSENGKIYIHIDGYVLARTCFCCPEQYDAYKGGKKVGYIRLRHGTFRVDYPDCMQENLLIMQGMEGDGLFYDDERPEYLRMAVKEIDERINLPAHKKFVRLIKRKLRRARMNCRARKASRRFRKALKESKKNVNDVLKQSREDIRKGRR
jgi:hypothetical protein